jgi:SAM-dependent methyltransferase
MHTDLATALATDEYTRARLHPSPSDYLYLHLADLRDAVGIASKSRYTRILDFGCGGSPYRGLFACEVYHRADFVKVAGIDFTVSEDSLVPEAPSSDYDLVLSTQVLEHLSSPTNYLQESMRVLKPGGSLVISTHGTFPEHGVPYDYQRWTSDGLSRLVGQTGFENIQIFKMSTGPRAVMQLAEDYWVQFREAARGPKSIFWKLLDRFFVSQTARRNRWMDKHFPECRLTEAKAEDSNSLYIGLYLTATKPTPKY